MFVCATAFLILEEKNVPAFLNLRFLW